jgi:4-amino-4-deoxy-L-arabinose transferase-like glycosyltransferase
MSALTADGRRYVAVSSILFALAAGIAAWSYEHRGISWQLHSRDAFQYAEMGRRLAEGEGFTTGVIHPAELRFGAGEDHPAVYRPPFWPLLLAATFLVTGPEEWAVSGAVGIAYLGVVAAATALAWVLGGPMLGALVGSTVALSQSVRDLAMDGVSETCFALIVTLVLLLQARRTRPIWIGIACGLAYLTRYNGLLLLPGIVVAQLLEKRSLRSIAGLLTGFVIIVAPWWIRNALVAENPFYSLLNLNLGITPGYRLNASLLFMLDPEPSDEMSPWSKLVVQLPQILRHWPLAAWNLPACIGILVGCARRDRLAVGFAVILATTAVGVSFGVATGRYFVPFLPATIAIGASGWNDVRGGIRILALGLVIVAPLLPAPLQQARDVSVIRAAIEKLRRVGSDEGLARYADLSRCWTGRPLVLADHAERTTWYADAISIYSPAREKDFWTILDRYPVQYVISKRRNWLSPQFHERFDPMPDCGPGVFQRRALR